MLQALGYAFLDKDGKQVLPGARGLKDITEITAAYVIPELAECKFRVACDVTNPLCGELGCSSIYGPQKGATPEMIQTWISGWVFTQSLQRSVFRKQMQSIREQVLPAEWDLHSDLYRCSPGIRDQHRAG